MIVYAWYFLVISVIMAFFGYPEIWIASVLISSNVCIVGHMVVKEMKK